MHVFNLLPPWETNTAGGDADDAAAELAEMELGGTVAQSTSSVHVHEVLLLTNYRRVGPSL